MKKSTLFLAAFVFMAGAGSAHTAAASWWNSGSKTAPSAAKTDKKEDISKNPYYMPCVQEFHKQARAETYESFIAHCEKAQADIEAKAQQKK